MSGYEKQRTVDYYDEMIADRIESGIDEEEAVSELGTPEHCAEKTLAEAGIKSNGSGKCDWLYREDGSGKMKPVWIILLVAGSPLWLGLICGALGLALGLAGGAFGFIVGIVCACAGLAFGGIASVIYGFVALFQNAGYGLMCIGGGLVAFSLGAIAAIYLYKLTAFVVKKIKNRRKTA